MRTRDINKKVVNWTVNCKFTANNLSDMLYWLDESKLIWVMKRVISVSDIEFKRKLAKWLSKELGE